MLQFSTNWVHCTLIDHAFLPGLSKIFCSLFIWSWQKKRESKHFLADKVCSIIFVSKNEAIPFHLYIILLLTCRKNVRWLPKKRNEPSDYLICKHGSVWWKTLCLSKEFRPSISITSCTLDSPLDLLSGFKLWFTGFPMQTPNPCGYQIGKRRIQPLWVPHQVGHASYLLLFFAFYIPFE